MSNAACVRTNDRKVLLKSFRMHMIVRCYNMPLIPLSININDRYSLDSIGLLFSTLPNYSAIINTVYFMIESVGRQRPEPRTVRRLTYKFKCHALQHLHTSTTSLLFNPNTPCTMHLKNSTHCYHLLSEYRKMIIVGISLI